MSSAAGARFALDEDTAVTWLAHIVADSENGPEDGRHRGIDSRYRASAAGNAQATAWLIRAALEAHVITSEHGAPEALMWQFDDDQGGTYRWVLTCESCPAIRAAYGNMWGFGLGHDNRETPGAGAALAVLREAVRAGNDLAQQGCMARVNAGKTKMADVARFDGYAVEPPAGEWSYVIDCTGIVYRRGLVAQRLRPGWWPFAYADSDREQRERHDTRDPVTQECGVAALRLAPDCKYWAWRNEYVNIGPDRQVPYLAHASVTVWAGSRRTLPCAIHLDMKAGTSELARLPADAPADVIAHAHLKAARLIRFLTQAQAERDGTASAPVTAAELEEQRNARQHDAIRAYCGQHGMTYAPVEGWTEYAVIDGERQMLYEVAAKYIPGLFASDPTQGRQ